MKADNTGEAGGAGAGLGGATAVLTGRRFEHAVAAMNAQIEQDLYALGQTGQLPDVSPVLPLNYRPKGVLRLLLGSILLGTVGVGALTFVTLTWFGLTSSDYSPGSVLVQGFIFAFVISLLTGWVPGLFVYMFRQTRETSKRLTERVYERYAAYWQERLAGQAALRDGGAQPYEGATRLGQHPPRPRLGGDY